MTVKRFQYFQSSRHSETLVSITDSGKGIGSISIQSCDLDLIPLIGDFIERLNFARTEKPPTTVTGRDGN